MDILILVLLGTQDKQFNRLLEEIDKQIIKGNIKEEVIVQAGHTKYISDKMTIFDLISGNEFNKYIEEADLIITHGGVGSIITAIKLGKKVIACPRLKQYKEHTNDHQIQIIDTFTKANYIIGMNDVSELEEKLKQIKQFEPKKVEFDNSKMINIIENFISESNQ